MANIEPFPVKTHASTLARSDDSAAALLMVAGELSGDMHGAALIRALRRRCPDLAVYGIGGPAMRAEGMETLYDAADMATMGVFEALWRLPFFLRAFSKLLALTRQRRPDAVVLIDYPGFNLRFARKTHALGIKTVYYICPQVWAWRRARIPRMAAILDRLLTIFPFEPPLFADTDLTVDYVGHPLVDELRAFSATPPCDLPWQGSPRIALLPGSRPAEVRFMLPTLWRAAGLLQKDWPDASFIVAAPSEAIATLIRARLAGLNPAPVRWSVAVGQTREVLRQATAALVASGTATLEAALLGCPMLLVYKMAGLTWFLAKRVVETEHIGLANIVAGRRVCPEFLQNDARPLALKNALTPLLSDTPERARMLADFRAVQETLGDGGAADRAAAAVWQTLEPE